LLMGISLKSTNLLTIILVRPLLIRVLLSIIVMASM